ncbi:hypothetical protein L798_10030 [Zootermopsis nevadensis]|uniref:Uncharacterized protein n=1 Tax=Zootermopsis nevadensis TaxID=136037 RepID=A0A067RBU3_ZOONE|nr:hypothetical protein L798_10030 [Zootermopsis nevadensis]
MAYRSRRFITELTKALRWTLSWADKIQSPSTPIYHRSHPTLSSHLHLGFPSDLFPSGFPTNTRCTPIVTSMRATCPTNLILLDLITLTILRERYKILNLNYAVFPRPHRLLSKAQISSSTPYSQTPTIDVPPSE